MKSRKGTARPRARLGIGLVLLIAATTACSGSTSVAAAGPQVNVRLSNFAITTDKSSVPAGTIVLRVSNAGPSAHGLHIDRTEFAAGALPLKHDNLTANDKAKGLHEVGRIHEVELDQTRSLTLRLRPGHYVLWCNREGHYLGGMYMTLRVQ